MNEYDRSVWSEIERWRVKRLTTEQRYLLPERAREKVAATKQTAQDRLSDLPGAEKFAITFKQAFDGLLSLVQKSAEATVRRNAVVRSYAKQGHSVVDLDDIRKLELRDIDKVKPRLGLRYTAASAVEGAGAGLVVSGGEILAAGGAVAGAGAGAAPGAGAVAATIVGDAVAVLATMSRAVSHTAAYYGYNTEQPGEEVFALGVLNFGLAQQAGKGAAYAEINKLVQALAHNAAWQQLNKNGVTHVVRRVYEALGYRLTKAKLGQALPAVGIVIGAGLNARLLASLTRDADHIYRERHLREKYGLESAASEETDEDTLDIVAFVDEAIDEEPRDAAPPLGP